MSPGATFSAADRHSQAGGAALPVPVNAANLCAGARQSHG
jgi:hypothetical protein